MHKNSFPLCNKCEIWASRDILPVQTKSETEPMHQAANRQLRACIFAPNAGHQLASGLTCQYAEASRLSHGARQLFPSQASFHAKRDRRQTQQHLIMLRAISLFTGAGGLDLGFEAAGFSIVASVELDRDARQTIAKNRPNWRLLQQGDIHLVDPCDTLQGPRLNRRELDVLIAGPPCQAFSKPAFWSSGTTERLEDPRATVFTPLLEIIETALPRAVLIENVGGIVTKDDVISAVRRRLARINRLEGTKYRLGVFRLNALDFGVRQRRERAFLIAFRDGRMFSPPARTHGGGNAEEIWRTAWDAIGDLVHIQVPDELKLCGKWAELLPSIPEGENYLFHTSKGEGLPLFGWRTRYWSFLLKLAKALPSWTLQAQPGPATGPFHWYNRQLSIREMCRLQTFPDSYQIMGRIGPHGGRSGMLFQWLWPKPSLANSGNT
jgi:DNA (cytosine-5)-methyltransferase 1